MNRELLDVIIPVYNTEFTLKRCLNSILNQCFNNYKIILIDDGSTDLSNKICDRYAEKYNNIVVFHNLNRGRAAARNYGLTKAKGKYIMFVDSDDWVESDFCNKPIQYILKYNYDIITFGYFKDSKDHEEEIRFPSNKYFKKLSKEQAYKLLLNDVIGSFPWNKIYKRDLFKNIKYPVAKNFEDIATTYKLFNKAKTIGLLDECLYHYVQRKNSVMNNLSIQTISDALNARKKLNSFIITNYPKLTDIANSELVMNYLQYIIYSYKENIHDKMFAEAESFLRKINNRKLDTNVKTKFELYLFIHQRWLFKFLIKLKYSSLKND